VSRRPIRGQPTPDGRGPDTGTGIPGSGGRASIRPGSLASGAVPARVSRLIAALKREVGGAPEGGLAGDPGGAAESGLGYWLSRR
jgi:hypothetical protein